MAEGDTHNLNLNKCFKNYPRVRPREAKGFELVEFKVIFKIIPLGTPANDNCVGSSLPELINNGLSTTLAFLLPISIELQECI